MYARNHTAKRLKIMENIKFHYVIKLFFLSASLIKFAPETKSLMPLKYQQQIAAFAPTEEDWKEFEGLDNKPSFRWVFEDMAHEKNFSPVYSSPERLAADRQRGKLTFKGWALSFFDTKKNAKTRLEYFTKGKPNLYKKLGTHIAEGVINSTDGITEIKCSEHGHFNHFENEGTDFYKGRFEIVDKITI
jgi:hypothetical protein